MQRLKGKTAVITGGAQGIGLVTAEVFAQEGADVEIWDINADIGEFVVSKLSDKNLNVGFRTVNVVDLEAVSTTAAECAASRGGIDILINNAGITRDARLEKMTAELWQQVLDVNLTGVFNTTKAVVPYMIEKKFGRIITASSVVGLYGNYGQSNYVASKSGVIGMTKVWARELGRHAITANAIAPGFIATEMVETVPEKILKSISEKTPLGRMGRPEEVAHAYLFLASDEASFITGAVLSVDGGLTV